MHFTSRKVCKLLKFSKLCSQCGVLPNPSCTGVLQARNVGFVAVFSQKWVKMKPKVRRERIVWQSKGMLALVVWMCVRQREVRATQSEPHLMVMTVILLNSTSDNWNVTPELFSSFSSTPCCSLLLSLSPQLNETAKQLMEIDKPAPTNVPGPSSEPAPVGPCSPCPSPSASPSNGNGSGHRRGEGKKNAKKRHSFTALSVSQRSAQLNNRHSMEISHPILISSSDPRAAARIQVHKL